MDELKRITDELRAEAAGLRKMKNAREVGQAEGMERAVEVLENEVALDRLDPEGGRLLSTWTWYDSMTADFRAGGLGCNPGVWLSPQTRLFYGHGLGNRALTNMSVPGSFGDEWNYITGVGLYVVCTDREIFEAVWPATIVAVDVNSKPMFELAARQLLDPWVGDDPPAALRGRPVEHQHCAVADSRGLFVGPRHSLSVTVEFWRPLDRMLERFSKAEEPGSFFGLSVLLHSRRVRQVL